MKLTFDVQGGTSAGLSQAFGDAIDAGVQLQSRKIADSYAAAMRAVGASDKALLRADLAQGGFYRADRLAKTWRANVYPRQGGSLDPALQISNKAGIIVQAFSQGVTITPSSRKWLAIPLDPAKVILRRANQAKNRTRTWGGKFDVEDSGVKRVERALGIKLVPIINKSTGRGVLIANGTYGKSGRRLKRQTRPTPFFALVREATLKKRIKGLSLLDDIAKSFPGQFDAAVAIELQRVGQTDGN